MSPAAHEGEPRPAGWEIPPAPANGLPVPERMRAAIVTEIGGPETMQPGTMPVPVPANSETLVRVRAAGVNPIDGKMRSGAARQLTTLPWVVGGDFAGVVARAPYELAPFQPGDEVYGMLLQPRYLGAQAEYVACPLMSLARKPRNLSFHEAGAVPLPVLTAWAAIVEIGRVYSGQRILVHAGAGGVGHLAVQLGRIYGAEIVTTASAERHEWLRSLGASQVIDYRQTPFEEAMGKPTDVVVDLIGNVREHTGSRSLDPRVLRDGGLYICVPSGGFPAMHDEIAAQGRDLIGTGLKLSPDGEVLRTIAQLFEQDELRVHIDRVLPLAQAGQAQRLIEEGHVRGKIVLDIGA